MSVEIRAATSTDTDECARLLYEAFQQIADRHSFPPDFDRAGAEQTMAHAIGHPSVFGVVAEADGRLVGLNFLREFNPIRGVGPVCVDPSFQAAGLGRQLMLAVLERAGGAPGVRLVQDAFNMESLALYASLGFEVREPLVLVRGRPTSRPVADVEVRPFQPKDLEACVALSRKVHGFERAELRDAVEVFRPVVALRGGRIVAYASAESLDMKAHGVASTERDLRALLLGLAGLTDQPLQFLVPLRRATFFRWCLVEGFRGVKPMTLMGIGEYRDPEGGFFPSVAY